MSAADFLDTNVLLYLLSNDTTKANRATELLAGGPTISVQVLNEIASISIRKLSRQLRETEHFLADVRRLCGKIVPVTVHTHTEALQLMARYSLSVYDALIVSAALEAGCVTLFSEDLQDGQRLERLIIRNPFK